jgi:16S rRNA (adenine1518-N6/adenine1519-N6)-dimethyltransferase
VKAGEVRELLRASDLSPKKSFGQNFLVSESVLSAMAEACIPDDEVGCAEVVELGAGLGALTRALALRARHVTCVERDRDLVPILERTLQEAVSAGKVTVSESDAQSLDVATAFASANGPRVLCGNLPYQITGDLLRLATTHAGSVERVVFMVQEEVADRLLAAPSSGKAYGALTVFARAAFDITRAARVPPGAFFPIPKVSSAIVVLTPVFPRRAHETEMFRSLVKGAFSMRRKTLRNAWRPVVADSGRLDRVAATMGVSLDARGETLDVETFARVAAALEAEGEV